MTIEDAERRMPKIMKLKPLRPNEQRYAVAVREGSDLWLVLWVRRSPEGDFYVMLPREDRKWNVHASYHHDGNHHLKSYGGEILPSKRQSLTEKFIGTEQIISYFGFDVKYVGAVCDPAAFSKVVELPTGILGAHDGGITIDLVEPGCNPASFPWAKIHKQEFIRDTPPWVVITVGSMGE
jgi:hypothetical protein